MINIESFPSGCVFKFGGTGVGNHAVKCARIVMDCKPRAVIVSALSGTTKLTGTTNCLLKIADLISEKKDFNKEFRAIEDFHLSNCQLLDIDPTEVQKTLQDLQQFCMALEVIAEVSDRSKDVLISFGEKLSAKIFHALLRKNTYPAEVIDITNIPYPDVDGFAPVIDYIQNNCSHECTVIVSGFFGLIPKSSLLTRVGRGYSDLTAVLTAIALRAENVVIWKEVDGVYSADPHRIKNARLLTRVRPEEATELTYYGSEVIHQMTMWQACQYNLKIYIKSIHDPSGSGSMITQGTCHHIFIDD